MNFWTKLQAFQISDRAKFGLFFMKGIMLSATEINAASFSRTASIAFG
jgi:hypothetical protein